MTGAAAAGRLLLRRLSAAVLVVAGVTALTFVLIHAAPGDPIYMLAGDGGSPAYYDDMRTRYGLDRPLPEQFVRYARAVITGDLGYSFIYQAPVGRVLLDHAPASALLAFTALGVALLGGLGAALVCAAAPGGPVDRAVRLAASIGYAAPVFWTGQMLILLLAVKLSWLPAGGMSDSRVAAEGWAYAADVLRHLALPAAALSVPFWAVIARVARASLLDVTREAFMQASYARGFTRGHVLVRHAAPVALVPVVALVGAHAASLVAGAAVTEALFGWPGLGHLVLHASLHRDYPLVTGAFILISAGVVVLNALTDAACAWLDPRIRAS